MVYVTTELVPISTMHRQLDDDVAGNANNSTANSTNNSAATASMKNHTTVQHINQPPVIEASRYNLPVSAMQYKIINDIRSHVCTIQNRMCVRGWKQP